jgi:hypothetical protein
MEYDFVPFVILGALLNPVARFLDSLIGPLFYQSLAS